MEDCKGISTPMEIKALPGILVDPENIVNCNEYQSKLGKIIYAMLGTRPDLSFVISTLSKFNSAPTDSHLFAAKRVLRYLKQTNKLGLTYSHNASRSYVIPELNGYSDSDHAGDRDDRRSTSGYVFILQGAAVLWKSNKQTMVTLSSTE